MKFILSVIALTFITTLNVSFGQETESAIVEYPDKEASYPGGPAELKRFISENIRYPEEAIKNEEEGAIIVKLIIDEKGETKDVEIERGVSPSLDKEAVRVVDSMPRWNPAELNGEPVKSSARIPIMFRLP